MFSWWFWVFILAGAAVIALSDGDEGGGFTWS